VPAAFVLI
jgi:ABC-2 type transport system permease protein